MNRILPFLLVLALLPLSALAAGDDIPQIDPAAAGIAARPIASGDDAVAYAKALWASDYLSENTDGMIWHADLEDNVYTVTARTNMDGMAELTAILGADGSVIHLYNNASRYDADCTISEYDRTDEKALAAYLLHFADALRPGAPAAIESFKAYPELVTYDNLTIVTFSGTVADGNGTVIHTTVEVSPRVRILDYHVFVPLPPSENSRG